MQSIQSPLPQFFDLDGSALDAGYVYIGTAGANPETTQIAVFWDAAGTQPAAQPLRTVGGYVARDGTPSQAFYNATDFSITVRDRTQRLVFSSRSVTFETTFWTPYMGTLLSTIDNRGELITEVWTTVKITDPGLMAAIQAAIDAPTTREIVLPGGDIPITSPGLVLRDGIMIRGQGRGLTRLLKSDYSGAAITGTDTDDVCVAALSIVGPGDAVGSGNRGIDIRAVGQPLCKSVSLRDLDISELNDAGVYLKSCANVSWSGVRVHDYGTYGIWIDGGDGHHLAACSTQLGLRGIYVSNPAGFGPTTLSLDGCTAEQNGRGIWFNGAVCCTASACGVKTAVNYDATNNGTSWTISGGSDVTLLGCLSRNDTIAVAVSAPHVLVDASAARVSIDGFTMVNSGSFPAPTWELDCQNAASVTLGRNNFTVSRIRSNGKITSLASVFSGSQSYTAGVDTRYTFAHGLGQKPSRIHAFLECTVADHNYAVGDQIELVTFSQGNSASARYPDVIVYTDTTNVYVQISSNGLYAWGANFVGGQVNLTTAKWAVNVRAWY